MEATAATATAVGDSGGSVKQGAKVALEELRTATPQPRRAQESNAIKQPKKSLQFSTHFACVSWQVASNSCLRAASHRRPTL